MRAKGLTKCDKHGCQREIINHPRGKTEEVCPICEKNCHDRFRDLPFASPKSFNATDHQPSKASVVNPIIEGR